MVAKFKNKSRTNEAENWQKIKNSHPQLKIYVLVLIKKKVCTNIAAQSSSGQKFICSHVFHVYNEKN